MFRSVKATTVEEYLAQVPPERQEIINHMHRLVQDTVPSLKPHFAYNMIGYGNFKYQDSKKREGVWPVIALANQKNYVSLYVCAVKDGAYLAETYKDSLGKVSVGKSCIRFKKLDDLNFETLKQVLKLAEASPGLLGATT